MPTPQERKKRKTNPAGQQDSRTAGHQDTRTPGHQDTRTPAGHPVLPGSFFVFFVLGGSAEGNDTILEEKKDNFIAAATRGLLRGFYRAPLEFVKGSDIQIIHPP